MNFIIKRLVYNVGLNDENNQVIESKLQLETVLE